MDVQQHSEIRTRLVEQLRVLPWFQATKPELQQKLLSLPEGPKNNCNGFLEHLVNRQAEGGGVRLMSLHDLLIPTLKDGQIYGLFPVFTVQKLDKPEIVFTYQYFSWRQGSESGSKGLVLMKGRIGEITHVVCLRDFSFAVGNDTFDLIGGFAEIDEESVTKIVQAARREICEELGLERFELHEVIKLGPVHVDRGMTPNCPQLFAAVIDGSDATRLDQTKNTNSDIYEMAAGPRIIPVADLWGPSGFIMQNTDSFFGTCIARLIALGALKPA